jgi:hypothetical protein
MISTLKESLWNQFGASMDMLKNTIAMCPDEYWNSNHKLFYSAYHCMIFLDYYLTLPPTHFSTPLPFTITASNDLPEGALDDLVPNRKYGKNELLDYLKTIRLKCYQVIGDLTEERLQQRWIAEPDPIASSATMNFSVLEILLYNMRHVQHHTAQLNLLLRQGINHASGWVSRANNDV